jgi:DHA2 family multidrug resistance protein
VPHLSPLNQPYVELLHRNTQALIAQGDSAASAGTAAVGLIYQTLRTQASVLAYSDIFMYTAILAFAAAPFALLFTGSKGGRGAGPAH